jgi:hypothetical protein
MLITKPRFEALLVLLQISPRTTIHQFNTPIARIAHLSSGTKVSFLDAFGVLHSYCSNSFNQNLVHEEELTADFTELR